MTRTKNLDPFLAQKYSCLLRDKEVLLPLRFRALFTLRNFPESDIAEDAIIKAVKEENESYLFKHEAVYCLGQMQSNASTELFKSLVSDPNENSMVRHEAAEALGVLHTRDNTISYFLEKYINDDDELVRDTCQLALQRIQWAHNDTIEASKFDSHDPTPPHSSKDLTFLGDLLSDKNASLFDRYRAMMALRNIESKESIEILCNEMHKQRDGEALFRHELAFILGQLQHPVAVNALIETLANKNQHYVIRHECAFALGSVGGYSLPRKLELQELTRDALSDYSTDEDQVVSESCLVGLDIMMYEDGDEFDMSDGLTQALSKYDKFVADVEN
ncbi:hypothetical protein GJ496_005446 [Pomphorhynchus laevis]|nr:hypothetical protein GJ496_005446 [Pomphorhynchus laevis]